MSGLEEAVAAVDRADGAVVAVDADGVIVAVNASARSLTRYDDGELVGEHVEALVPSSSRWAHARYRLGFVTEPSPRQMGIGLDPHIVRKDGSLVPVEIHLTPFADADDIHVVATITPTHSPEL